MRSLMTLASVAGGMLIASTAQAGVLITAADPGKVFTIDYTGKVNGSSTNLVSALSTFTFNGTSNNGKTFNFSYSLTNDSSVSARLRSFGFNITSAVDPTGGSSTGTYGIFGSGDNFPEGLGTRDVCFRVSGGDNCTGGPNGLTSGQTATGTLSLIFATAQTSILLDDFAVRFQSISPSVNGSNSGVGIGALVPPPVTAVPEPASWALMILGFGTVGGMMRRKRQAVRVNFDTAAA